MRKKIGIVSEGPTDYLMLKTAIDTITGEDNIYLSIQPEADMLGRYGFGWKGVWRWCKESENIAEMMSGIQPGIDAWIVAAYDEDLFDIEDIENPWKNIIAKGKYYHNIRVRGDKKNTVAYAGFMDKVAENWGRVTEKCNSAKLLEEDVKRILVNRR